jgi:hypothetical protein
MVLHLEVFPVQVQWDQLDQVVHLDQQDHRELQVRRELQVLKDQVVQLEILDHKA